MKKTRIIMWILVLLWAGLIFSFSAQNADQSSETSGRLVSMLLKLFEGTFQSEEQQEIIVHTLTLIIRKGAHFSEYLVFGSLLTGLISTYTKQRKIIWPSAWFAGTIYAASDEIHQLFSSGRSGEVKDVCLDSAGVLTGVLIGLVLLYVFAKGKRKKTGADITE